ncbi:MAG: hypothetical protein ACK4WD_15385 [Flavobacteriales bacterium]|jgi:hypothetical protein
MDNDFENESYRYWQEKAISHLTLTNQFLTGISLAFLAFCFNEFNFKECNLTYSVEGINWSITLQALSMCFILISVILGIVVIFVRLIDFRITRNVSLSKARIRQELIKKKLRRKESQINEYFDVEFETPKLRERVDLIFLILFNKYKLISREETKERFNDPAFYEKINDLRALSFGLGTISWKIPNRQLLMIVMSVIFYVTSLVI